MQVVGDREKSRSRSGTLGREERHGWEPLAAWEEPEGLGGLLKSWKWGESSRSRVLRCYFRSLEAGTIDISNLTDLP